MKLDAVRLKVPSLLGLALTLSHCGGQEAAPPVVVPKLSAEEAILQVSNSFSTTSEARRLLSPPSELAIHQRRVESQLVLQPTGRVEKLRLGERFEYRNGRVVECAAEAKRPLKAVYRFVQGEATVKLSTDPLEVPYRCTGPMPTELSPVLPASASELVLREESLVVVAPATDRRRFLPTE